VVVEEVVAREVMKRVFDEREGKAKRLGDALGRIPHSSGGRARPDEEKDEHAQIASRQPESPHEFDAADPKNRL